MSDLRQDKLDEAMEAIAKVRDIVAGLTDQEKAWLRNNSPTYRQLVEACRVGYVRAAP